jgi:hypothetical protein
MTITTKRNLILAGLLAGFVWAIVWGFGEMAKLSEFSMENASIAYGFVIMFGCFGSVIMGVALLRRIWTEAE